MRSNFVFRKAVIDDARTIRQMVRDEWLNPFGLNWQNFWVIEKEHTAIACGQLRPRGDIKELSSLAVLSEYRKQGIGTYLVRHIIRQTDAKVYLSCGSSLKSFYSQLGFKQVSWSKLPSQLKYEFGLSRTIATIRRKQLIFMKHQ